MSRKRRARRQALNIRGLDVDALNGLCEVRQGHVVDGAGLPLLVVRPRDDVWPADVCEFDRAVCAAGLKRFIRPVASGEWPSEAPVRCPGFILVEEVALGIRWRMEISIHNPGVN